MKKIITLTVILLAACGRMRADEGMWMVSLIDSALEKKMQERGLALGADEIYNADAPGAGLTDAIVSLQFGCTGSIISDSGLMITNHHCAYGDVFDMSTPEHNYLEEGFWAMTSDQEANIPGKSILFLKRVLDVTDEVAALKEELAAEDKPFGFRKISHAIETKYAEETGLEAILSSMWSGSKYYLSLYLVYSDVRLVAAPPVSIASYGGDIDNWEWPQHKGDFALYRIYTAPDGSPAEYSPENVPLKPVRKLEISLEGYKPGDYAMVIGYPGRTERYSSSEKIAFDRDLSLPIFAEAHQGQMDVIGSWMNADPDVRLKYSDSYFGLTNVLELYAGTAQCYRRFKVAEEKAAEEELLQEWIEASPDRAAKWGSLLSDLKTKYAAQEAIQRNTRWYRETTIGGSTLAIIATRLHFRGDEIPAAQLDKDYNSIDMRVERDIFRSGIELYYTHVDSACLGPFQTALLEEFSAGGKTDFDAMVHRLWDGSCLTDRSKLDQALSGDSPKETISADSLYRFYRDVAIRDLNQQIDEAQGEPSINDLEKEYTHALYQMRMDQGRSQYPDANSTMRLTYGQVSGVEPRDGIICSYRSTTAGILEKYNPEVYDFNLDERQKSLLEARDWGKWADSVPEDGAMFVDFLTDNDITGGNSGSPVMNARGELIGLAFDGNKESLASDASYTPLYNKCVCVDIRYVLWILDRYAHLDRILTELGLN